MDHKEIKKEIDRLNEGLNLLEVENAEVEPCLDVFEFNKISSSLKARALSQTSESEFFKNIFNNEDYYENISEYLTQTKTSLYYKIEKAGVSLEANANLQRSLNDVKDIIDILVVEYQMLTQKNKKITRNSDDIKNILSDLAKLKSRMQKVLHMDSKIVSNVVLKEFKMIFNSFFNCIKVAKKREDELLLIEIAGITDKIMTMINPVFTGKSLKTSELIYHYLIYELRELKTYAIGDTLA